MGRRASAAKEQNASADDGNDAAASSPPTKIPRPAGLPRGTNSLSPGLRMLSPGATAAHRATAAPRATAATGTSQWPLRLLAALAIGAVIWAGQRFLIPMVAGLLLALLVVPLVIRLSRVLHSEAAAAALVVLFSVAVTAAAAFAFSGHLIRVFDRMPDMIRAVAHEMNSSEATEVPSVIGRVRDALSELDKAAARLVAPGGAASALPQPRAARKDAETGKPGDADRLSTDTVTVMRETAKSSSGALMNGAGTMSLAFFVALFVLAGGRRLAGRFLDLWGTETAARVCAAEALAEAARQTRVYAGVLLVTNVILGAGVYAAFLCAGLPDPGGWAVAAALLHVVPYLGMALLSVLGAAETYLVYGNIGAAAGMAGFIILLSVVIGTFVAAWLQARSSKMSPAAIFIGLMFWGAMWGAWGLLLGPAMVVLTKVAADHIPAGGRIARLLGG
jgi:predicted PurR-regulated permease PerM